MDIIKDNDWWYHEERRRLGRKRRRSHGGAGISPPPTPPPPEPPELLSACVGQDSIDRLQLVFDKDTDVSTLGTIVSDGAAITVTGIVSGNNTTSPVLQLSRVVLAAEVMTYSILHIEDFAVTNKIHVIFREDFVGDSINTSVWTLANPDIADLSITQNDGLLFTRVTDNAIASTITNSITSIGTFPKQSVVSVKFNKDVGYTNSVFQLRIIFNITTDWIGIGQSNTTPDRIRLVIVQGGILRYDFTTLVTTSRRVKIEITATQIKFYHFNQFGVWVQLGDTRTDDFSSFATFNLLMGSGSSASDDAGDVLRVLDVIVSNQNWTEDDLPEEEFVCSIPAPEPEPEPEADFISLAVGDPHTSFEDRIFSYNSIQTPFSHYDAMPWEIAMIVGDFFAYDDAHLEAEMAKTKTQFDNALSVHKRAAVYTTMGNSDYHPFDDPSGANWGFIKYIDPLGENTAFSGVDPAEFPITPIGTYDKYTLQKGNVLYVMMSDRNDRPADQGQGDLGRQEWRVSGGVTLDQWQWLHDVVLKNTDKIIVVCFHQALWETTIGSGYDEFRQYKEMTFVTEENRYAGVFAYYNDLFHNDEIVHFIKGVEGNIHFWLTGHVHNAPHDTFMDRAGFIEKYGIHNQIVGPINRNLKKTGVIKKSYGHFYYFNNASNSVKVRVYVVDDSAFDPSAERDLTLNKTFQLTYSEPTPATPSVAPSSLLIDNSVAEELSLSWTNPNTGVLIVRKVGEHATFTAVDDTTYYRDQVLGDGVVAFIGTVDSFRDYGLTPTNDVYYTVVPFNSGGGHIDYNQSIAIQSNEIVP